MISLSELLSPHELEIFSMPIVRFHARKHLAVWHAYGAETLARGPASRGLRSPEVLFQRARDWGLGLQLDLACFERSVSLLHKLPEGQRLFVNTELETFTSPELLILLQQCVPDSLRSRLVVEIVEGEVDDYWALQQRVACLQRLGCEVAIDDLGAEGSDLDRASRLGKVDYVKIDKEILMREWPRSPSTARAWLREALSVGRHLGATLLVEGVETSSRELLAELEELGIQLGQGYLFGGPLPSSELRHLERTPCHVEIGTPARAERSVSLAQADT